MRNKNLAEIENRFEACNSLLPEEESKKKRKQPFLYGLLYRQLWRKAKDIYGWAVRFSSTKKVSFDRLKKLIHQIEKDELLYKIMENLSMGDELLFNVFMPTEKYDILTHHAVNVTILSLKLGIAIDQYSEEELKDKFLIGILHHTPKAEFTAEYQKIIEKYQIKEQLTQLSQQKGKNEPEASSKESESSVSED